jgi:DUF2075 family protein
VIVYEALKTDFIRDHDDHDIEDVIRDRYYAVTGKMVSKSELLSWKASLGYMARVLRDEAIPDNAGVAVEYHIPQTSKRVDVTITGYDENHNKTAVIVELKQWEKAVATPKDGIVVTHLGGGPHETVHPSYQAWSYATLLEGFNEAVYSNQIRLGPCAYLHNYVRDGVIDSPQYEPYTSKAPLFLKGGEEREALRAFIRRHVRYGDNRKVLYEIEEGRIRPSKALADSLAGLMKGKPEFILIDDQKTVYEAVMAAAKAATAAKPQVVIVEGGPGTGKTVLAINLLVALTKAGLNGKYVSKNAAPRAVYQQKLTGSMTKTKFANFFTGSGAFIDESPNEFDFLVVDEAHRLNEKSGLYGNLGENQIKELVHSANCSVFFIDEDQRVTLADIGRKDSIKAFAAAKGAAVIEMGLASQFRCSGADGYLAWLDHVLGVRPTANTDFDHGGFEFRVFDDPVAMHAAIQEKNAENKARVVAGYCWPWNSKKKPSAYDIEIGGAYRRQWNLGADGAGWIVAPNSVEQVGCIHTCQGLEVDYIGVIIGPDLVVHDGKVVTNGLARDRHDKSMKGFKKWLKSNPVAAKEAADRIIKNTYRTLMTRGMKGCYVFSEDEETRGYFSSAVRGRIPDEK